MNGLKQQTLIVICGWAGSGKSSVAEIIQKELGLYMLEQDSTRTHFFGPADSSQHLSPEKREKNRLEMKATYELLRHGADYHLQLGNSLMLTACYSSEKAQDDLRFLAQKYPAVSLKIIWCYPQNDTQDEVEERMRKRLESNSYLGSMNSYEFYVEVKNRFAPITLPHVRIDTSPPNYPQDSAREALRYILE